MVEARRERKHAVDRHEPEGRLEADHATAGGGDPDRAAGVRAESPLDEPEGECGRGAAATRDQSSQRYAAATRTVPPKSAQKRAKSAQPQTMFFRAISRSVI